MDPTVATLQNVINRFAAAEGFASVAVDGSWGARTKQGVYDALAFIGQGKCYRTACPDDVTSKAAAGLMAQWDGAANAAKGLAEFIGRVADELGLPHVPAPIPGSGTPGPIYVPTFRPSLFERFKAWPLWQQLTVGMLTGLGLIFVVNRVRPVRPVRAATRRKAA